MIEAICNAIDALYAGASAPAIAARALCNGLFLERAPSRFAEPYALYEITQEQPVEWKFGQKEAYASFLVRVAAYSLEEERTQVSALHAALLALFNFASLSVTGYSNPQVIRLTEAIEPRDGKWCFSAIYRVSIAQT